MSRASIFCWQSVFFAALAFFEPRMPQPSLLALGLYAWASGWALAQALRVWGEKGSNS
jgi:hypothetical protein